MKKASKKSEDKEWIVVTTTRRGLSVLADFHGPFESRADAAVYAEHCRDCDGVQARVELLTIEHPWVLEE